jgi:hypothetical protein
LKSNAFVVERQCRLDEIQRASKRRAFQLMRDRSRDERGDVWSSPEKVESDPPEIC